MVSIIQIRNAGLEFANKELGTDAQVISMKNEGDNWKQLVEIVEEKNVIEDILGIYELTLDNDSNVISFERKGLRKSGDVSPKDWEQVV